MAWGMPLATFTVVHVVLSLIGIGSGFLVMSGLVRGRERHGWTLLFLVTTAATSITGFGFPVDHLLPSHVIGVISLAVLAVAVLPRYGLRVRGEWRRTYVVAAAVALYLNVFVGVVQAFQKISPLHALAPSQTESPFLVAQAAVLALFVILTTVAARRFSTKSIRQV
jgi:hypothetical protein